MSNNIVQFNEEIIKGQIKELVRGSVEETLNELLEKEAESLTQAARYERSETRQGYRSGHYDRNLTTTSGDVTLHVPRLKGISFETAIIERYRRRESKKAAREKAAAVVAELKAMKLPEAAKKIEEGIEETLTYCDFPSEHWTRIRTNNVFERLNREIRRRTRVVGAFPDGNSALMLVCARLRHVAGTQWGCKKYMNMKHLEAMEQELLAV